MGSYRSYYDLGRIKNPKVLKGDMGDGNSVTIAFDNKGQDKHPYRHMLIPHSTGEEGIWLLRKDRVFTGHFFVIKPSNPLALSSEAEVLALIKEQQEAR